MQKRWEFGSQIHWLRFTPAYEPFDPPWEPGGVLAGSGRDALRLILEQRHWKRLWVPSYFCEDVLRVLLRCPVELVCFPDSPLQSSPDFSGIPFRDGDAVLVVNYFGLRRAEDISVPASVGVIEDHTHGPCSRWARESKADFCFASLRKIFPLPDGGVAWSPKHHPLPSPQRVTPELESASSARLNAMLLKAQYLDGHPIEKRTFLDLSTLGEDRFDTASVSAATQFSANLLSSLPLRRWEEQRRDNFLRFDEALSASNQFRILLPRDTQEAPFCVPVVFEDSELCNRVGSRLIQQSIYPTRLWPMDDLVLEGTPEEHRLLSRRMFVLACDARYGADDVDRVIDAIREEGLL